MTRASSLQQQQRHQQQHAHKQPQHHWASADDDTSRLYVNHQVLARSLEGRSLDLITITDCWGAATTAELQPAKACAATHRQQECGYDAPQAEVEAHPLVSFPGKKVFFISARVHPGETPATHLFNGMLAFLLRKHDQRARALRRLFVFKLVPIVNPDGVFWGHYRTDTHGNNLNRYYITPNEALQPTVWAIKQQLMQYAAQGTLEFYLDLHAHANKKGVFIYGNALEGEQALCSLLYARLVALNSPVFDFLGCNYTEKNMSRADKDGVSKEGAARVALYKAIKSDATCTCSHTHFYTIEANYNTARVLNPIAPAVAKHAGCVSPASARPRLPPRFTAPVLQAAGRGFLVAALDLKAANPHSRLPNCEHRSLEGVASWLCSVARTPAETRALHLPALSDACVDSLRALPSCMSATPGTGLAIGAGGGMPSGASGPVSLYSHGSRYQQPTRPRQHRHTATNTDLAQRGKGCSTNQSASSPCLYGASSSSPAVGAAAGGPHTQARFAKAQALKRAASSRDGTTPSAGGTPHAAPATAASASAPGEDASALAGPRLPSPPTQLPRLGSSTCSGIPSLLVSPVQQPGAAGQHLGRSTSLPARASTPAAAAAGGPAGGGAGGTQRLHPLARGPSGIPKPPCSQPAAVGTAQQRMSAAAIPEGRPGSTSSSGRSRHTSEHGSSDGGLSMGLSTRLSQHGMTHGASRRPVVQVTELRMKLSDPALAAGHPHLTSPQGRSEAGWGIRLRDQPAPVGKAAVLMPPQLNAWDWQGGANAAALVQASGPWLQQQQQVPAHAAAPQLDTSVAWGTMTQHPLLVPAVRGSQSARMHARVLAALAPMPSCEGGEAFTVTARPSVQAAEDGGPAEAASPPTTTSTVLLLGSEAAAGMRVVGRPGLKAAPNSRQVMMGT